MCDFITQQENAKANCYFMALDAKTLIVLKLKLGQHGHCVLGACGMILRSTREASELLVEFCSWV